MAFPSEDGPSADGAGGRASPRGGGRRSPRDAGALPARAFPPGRSLALPVRLRLDGVDAVLIEDGGTEWRRAPISALDVDAPLGRAPRRITFPDGTLVEVEDAAALDGFLGEGRWHLLHRLERLHPRLVLVVAGSLLGAWVAWRFALSAVVAVAVVLTPAAVTQAMDDGSLRTADALMLEPSALPEETRERVAAIHAELLAHLPERDRGARPRLLFRRMGDAPNAFALPGGTIVVTDGLIEQFDDPDLWAGVLAHELAHVSEAHGLENLYRSLGLYVMVSLVAGETGPVLEDVLLEGNLLLGLSHGRAAEREADAEGVALMRAAGYDPDGLGRFFDWVAAQPGGEGGWLSTHPGGTERADRVRGALTQD